MHPEIPYQDKLEFFNEEMFQNVGQEGPLNILDLINVCYL